MGHLLRYASRPSRLNPAIQGAEHIPSRDQQATSPQPDCLLTQRRQIGMPHEKLPDALTPDLCCPPPSPSPAPVEGQPNNARTRRSTSADVISWKYKKAAQTLVRQADADLAGKFATALMEQVNSNSTGRQQPIASGVVSAIPANSTFGQLWAQLTHTLKSEPFATFAKNNHIDLSNLKVTPSGWLDCTVNGKRRTFSNYETGFEQATVDVLIAARKLSPDNKSFVYVDEHSSTTRAVGNFTAYRFPIQKPRRSRISVNCRRT